MEEVWKEIEGFEGYYQVSNLGRVKSLSRKEVRKDRILKGTIKEGYVNVTLGYPEIKYKSFKVHRLVMLSFVSNPENKRTVNHIDGNPQNNKLDNLEWATDKENVRHAFKTGLASNKGVKNSQAKLSEKDVIEIKLLRGHLALPVVAKMYGISKGHVSNIQRGYNWREFNA